jgi:hypothetical protein
VLHARSINNADALISLFISRFFHFDLIKPAMHAEKKWVIAGGENKINKLVPLPCHRPSLETVGVTDNVSHLFHFSIGIF